MIDIIFDLVQSIDWGAVWNNFWNGPDDPYMLKAIDPILLGSIIIGGSQLLGSGVSAIGQGSSGRTAARSAEAQQQAAINFERETRNEIRNALSNFRYSQEPTNAFGSLQNYYDNLENRYEGLSNYYQDISNQYQNLPDTYAGLSSRLEGVGPADRGETAYTDVDNPFVGQQAALESAEFQRQGALQQQANVLDALQQGGGITAAGATALQREGSRQLQQIGAGIEQQERQIQRDFAGAELQRQLNVAQGRDRFALESAAAQDRFALERAASQERLDFARAGQQYQTAQLQAQQAQQNELLFADAETRNQLLAAQGAQQLDQLRAQQSQANQLLQAQDEVRIQAVREGRDESALSAAASGFTVGTSAGGNTYNLRYDQGRVNPTLRNVANDGYYLGGYNSVTGVPYRSAQEEYYQTRYGSNPGSYFNIG
ncbi:MAG: hypothetical protein MPJ25_00880 [Pirellulales bacterium]|nr:hypothetical protein [Pirellulales bacterium]